MRLVALYLLRVTLTGAIEVTPTGWKEEQWNESLVGVVLHWQSSRWYPRWQPASRRLSPGT
jgi:hypothetical protein